MKTLYDVTWRRITTFDNPEEASVIHTCRGLDERTLVARMIRATRRGDAVEIKSVLPSKGGA